MFVREALRPVEIEEPPKPVSNAIRKESTGILLMDRYIGINVHRYMIQ